ncbi:hypothetical protein CQA89_32215, partial [Klebsiella pneumoniae]
EATAGQPPMSMTSHVCMSARCFRARPASRYHAVAEEGIALRDIAAVIAHGLNLPLTHLEGSNRWSAAHVDDVARLYVSALLQGAAGEPLSC